MGRTTARLDRERDVLGLGSLPEESRHDRGKGGAPSDYGSGSEWVGTDLSLVYPGGIGRMGHVDGDRDVRSNLEGRGAGTEQAYFLLDRGNCGKSAGRSSGFCNPPQCLESYVASDPIVERAGYEASPGKQTGFRIDHHRVTDRDQRLGPLTVARPDVDVHLLEFDDLLSLLRVEEVDRFPACDSRHRAVTAFDHDPLADQDLGVPAPDRTEVEEALLVDVPDHQSDLVNVADDRDQRTCIRLTDRRDRGTEGIARNLGEFRLLAPGLGGRGLVARRGRDPKQSVEQFRGRLRAFLCHAPIMPVAAACRPSARIRLAGVISTNQFKNGTHIEVDGTVFRILDFQHVKPGKGGAFVRTRLRRIDDGSVIDKTFRAGEKFRPVRTESNRMQYLYESGDAVVFMDSRTYDQIELDTGLVADALQWLKPNDEAEVLFVDEKPTEVQVPSAVDLQVVTTEPGVKGDTASGGGTKPATLESGVEIQVPLFIEEGETVRVDTRSGEYVARA